MSFVKTEVTMDRTSPIPSVAQAAAVMSSQARNGAVAMARVQAVNAKSIAPARTGHYRGAIDTLAPRKIGPSTWACGVVAGAEYSNLVEDGRRGFTALRPGGKLRIGKGRMGSGGPSRGMGSGFAMSVGPALGQHIMQRATALSAGEVALIRESTAAAIARSLEKRGLAS